MERLSAFSVLIWDLLGYYYAIAFLPCGRCMHRDFLTRHIFFMNFFFFRSLTEIDI